MQGAREGAEGARGRVWRESCGGRKAARVERRSSAAMGVTRRRPRPAVVTSGLALAVMCACLWPAGVGAGSERGRVKGRGPPPMDAAGPGTLPRTS